MEWVMYLESQANGAPVHAFLKSVDVDAGDHVYSGVVSVTDDLADAIKFANVESVLACWRTQSARLPLRPDGRPNRPLTMYTIIPMIADKSAIQFREAQIRQAQLERG